MESSSIVIIGTGLAGYILAKELRKIDTQSHLVIVTANDGTFYSKPLLSTSLTAKREIAKIATADVVTMAKQLNAEIHVATTVSRIDSANKRLELLNGFIPYQKLVIATGSSVIRPPLLGNAVDDILSVNDLEDYARFCEVIAGKKKIAILGAGLVGCEFANDLINTHHLVHMIDPACYPLQRLLPERLGRILETTLAENGLNWHFGHLVYEVNRIDSGYRLVLSDRRQLDVEVVMSAIGLRPKIELAEKAGIKTNYGILVDRYLQTSHQDIFALGDCAEVGGLVLFFVSPLLQCAKALAKTLTGNPTQVVYPVMPVVLKTPSCPIVIASPPRNLSGNWVIEGEGRDLLALYYDNNKQLTGFALTGKKVARKNELVSAMAPLIV
jgi:rubredoxin-NAD+ reductase